MNTTPASGEVSTTVGLTYDILTLDTISGVVMAIVALSGIVGNAVSFCYFYKGKERLHDFLYCLMCLIDICTCLSSFPVVYTRLASRREGLFSFQPFCGAWAVVFRFSVVLALFNVVLVTLTRTIAILKPLYRITVKEVLISLLLFAFLVLLFDVALSALRVISFTFFREVGFCVVVPGDSPFLQEETLFLVWDHVFVPISALFFNGALIIVILSFIFSLVSLTRRTSRRLSAPNPASRQTRSFTRVTITIAIFTAVFILCNLPTVVNSVINAVRIKSGHVGGLFFFFNSDFLLRVFSNVLNAALNPVIYLWRMRKYKKWVGGLLPKGLMGGVGAKYEEYTSVALTENKKRTTLTFTQCVGR